VLFGAGGAGAAVASALLDYGVQRLYVVDPQPVQRDGLYSQLVDILSEGVELHTGEPNTAQAWVPTADTVVKATPIGMGHRQGTPFALQLLNSQQWVAHFISP